MGGRRNALICLIAFCVSFLSCENRSSRREEIFMITAEVLKNGDLQTIIFPKAFHLDADKVEIRHHANEIILIPLPKSNLEEAFYALTGLSDDFMVGGRQQPPTQTREDF